MGQWYWYEALVEGSVNERTIHTGRNVRESGLAAKQHSSAVCAGGAGMNESVRVLRVFGGSSDVAVPRQIAAGTVAEIGDYCFAEKECAQDYQICSDSEKFAWDGITDEEVSGTPAEKKSSLTRRDQAFEKFCGREGMLALAGKNVSRIELPDTLVKIGNFAFYQCRELEEISMVAGTAQIGSDAFMNCRRLFKFIFRGNPESATSLKQILAQRNEETAVCFVESGQIRASLLFPEYSEHYDLIGPAHIFELNIQGEGFRARQCFRDGVIDFEAYDRIFALECAEESVATLCRMACGRLLYPVKLQNRERNLYETYLTKNIDILSEILVSDRDYPGIEKFYLAGLLGADGLQNCLERAVSGSWTEGVRRMLLLRERKEKEETVYAFKDF